MRSVGPFRRVLAALLSILAVVPGPRAFAQNETQPASAGSPPAAPSAQDDYWPADWPRDFKADDGTQFIVYEPQLDSWNGNLLTGRAAVAVKSEQDKDPTYGVVWLTAQTTVDKEKARLLALLAELEDDGIEVDRYGGCSMGSLIAAMAAAGWSPQTIRDRCHDELVRRSPFNDYTIPRVALIRSRKAGRMLDRLFGGLTIEELAKPLFTVSADLLSSRLVIHRQGSVIEAVGASMSIPGLAPPLPHGGRLLVDGGVLNNLPVDAMADAAEGPIVAVDVVRRLEP